MKHYVFDTEQEALDYDLQVINLSNYPEGDNWSTPIKHPTLNKWAVAVSGKVVLEDREPQELTEDWINKD